MATFLRGRHYGYGAASGFPLFRELPSAVCAAQLPDYLDARHFGYGTSSAKPLFAHAWECCDAFCTDAEVLAGDCWKEPECWPFGEGPGLSKRMALYVSNESTCISAGGRYALVEYREGLGVWTGSVTGLRGGALSVTARCVDPVPGDDPQFALTFGGCFVGDPGSSTITCRDPLFAVYGTTEMPECCDCAAPGTGTTTAPGVVNITLAANCRRTVFARHVGYRDGVPLFARSRPCDFDADPAVGCGDMTCPVYAAVTSVSGCACLDGVEGWLDQTSTDPGFPTWTATLPTAGCDLPAVVVDVSCLGADPVGGEPTVTYSVRLTCGADNEGTGTVTFPAADLEDLDETVTVPMTVAGRSCGGDCTYQYHEMLGVWGVSSNTCTEGCDACEEDIPPTDPRFPPDPVDGQFYSIPCTASPAVPACCEGLVTVRLSR